MIPSYTRPSKVVVDLDAIRHNVKEEIKRIGSKKDLFAVVKANGYGHGAVQIAKTAIEAGATGLAVSNLDEALELRRANIVEPILVLSFVGIEFVPLAIANDVTLTATNLEWIKSLDKMIEQPIKIHLKIDSGMGRVGLRNQEEIKEAGKILKNNHFINFEGLFTHFAKADSKDTSYVTLQQERFSQAIEILGRDIKYIHASNSALALWHDAWESNLVRFGVAMYGMNPSGAEVEAPFELKQALTLETEITHIKLLEKKEKVGYGITYETKEDEWIATLPIGYADGFIRKFQGFNVLVNGNKAPVVGRICMDQCMIKLENELPVGTKVTIFGSNEGEFNSVQLGAEYVDTINYEVTCVLTDRLPRYYLGEH